MSAVKRYPTIAGMTPLQIEFEAGLECECRPDLPDGRSFPMCVPCKVRQDLQRYQEDQRLNADPTDNEILYTWR